MQKNPVKNINDLTKSFNLLYGNDFKNQIDRYQKIFDNFKLFYGLDTAYFASSSGRVEVIGNHTDHNGGLVIASAINLDTICAFYPNTQNIIRIKSKGYEDILVDINSNFTFKKGTSLSLVCGIVTIMKDKGYNVGGFDACIDSNVLGGVGISSSASFELLIVEILNFLYNQSKIDCYEKALISQRAEREFFGKPCGILDQTAISFGGLNLLDFSNENFVKVSKINNCKDFSFVLINTGSSHEDLTEEYAQIPLDMKRVCDYFDKDKLISIDYNEFKTKIDQLKDVLSERAVLRAEHFFEENLRVKNAYDFLNNKLVDKFIYSVSKSGESSIYKLKNCTVPGQKQQPILDTINLVKQFLQKGAVRVHGGGFAGSVLCVVKNTELDGFISNAKKHFNEKDVIVLSIREVGSTIL